MIPTSIAEYPSSKQYFGHKNNIDPHQSKVKKVVSGEEDERGKGYFLSYFMMVAVALKRSCRVLLSFLKNIMIHPKKVNRESMAARFLKSMMNREGFFSCIFINEGEVIGTISRCLTGFVHKDTLYDHQRKQNIEPSQSFYAQKNLPVLPL